MLEKFEITLIVCGQQGVSLIYFEYLA